MTIFIAHCLEDVKAADISILAGVTNLLDTTGQRRDVVWCKIHPEYDPDRTKISNDIAICKVSRPFIFNRRVSKIQLETEQIEGGLNCVVSGWGSQSPENIPDERPIELQFVTLPTISNEECTSGYVVNSLNRTY